MFKLKVISLKYEAISKFSKMLEIESGPAPKLRDFDKACTVLYTV